MTNNIDLDQSTKTECAGPQLDTISLHAFAEFIDDKFLNISGETFRNPVWVGVRFQIATMIESL